MKPNLLRFVVLLSLLVLPWSLYAQTVTGILPIRAIVTIRNVETGLERTQTTDAVAALRRVTVQNERRAQFFQWSNFPIQTQQPPARNK